MKREIETSEDVKFMVDSFYEKVNQDALLSPVFNDFAQVDWVSHLPRMYTFWESILFSTGTYQGQPFQKHIPLPVSVAHFDRWIALFVDNLDSHFIGEKAELAKHRAKTIAHIFKTKLKHLKKTS
ncbi:MAG: hemoglobin [Bacteroidia bacterium]|jgi:hemoglobin